ncbi:MAG: protein-arginine deiminase [Deltaproteobacteria bacterium]|nr:protein-arginine deiminase [Deltaproteobacteria bacterium]
MHVPTWIWAILLTCGFIAGCGEDPAVTDLDAEVAPLPGEDASTSSEDASAPGEDAATPGPDAGEPTSPVDLRADVNRNGTVDLADPTEDADEATWDSTHGAIFLANIDDDQKTCPKTGSDVSTLVKCNDAADEVINGADDPLDLARLKTVPWPEAPDDAQGTLSLSAPGSTYVRLFINRDSGFELFTPTTAVLTATEIRAGVELGIEGKDVVRDSAVWDGYLDVTFTVTASGFPAVSDTVRLRVAPIITRHHLDPPKRIYAARFAGERDSTVFISDLSSAMAAAGVPNPLYDVGTSQYVEDQWTQDYFETAYMAMPAVGGSHVIDVNIRSANQNYPRPTSSNPLRAAGKIVFSMLRGKDVAGLQQYDPRWNSDDTLNSFGNLETVPPYSHAGQSYPLGRIYRGTSARRHPDNTVLKLFESQKVQPALFVDTSWLLVGHVDETVTFLKADNARGWTIAIADPQLAKEMLQAQVDAGNGSTMMFAGQSWFDDNGNPSPAQITISRLLADTAIMSASATAAAEIDKQVEILKEATGITDAEILHLPTLFDDTYGEALAHMPGTANGISLGDAHYGSPKPHGPIINGADIFETQMVEEFKKASANVNITVHFIEDWNLYHAMMGEVHCGSNTTREVPASARWWESGL